MLKWSKVGKISDQPNGTNTGTRPSLPLNTRKIAKLSRAKYKYDISENDPQISDFVRTRDNLCGKVKLFWSRVRLDYYDSKNKGVND